MSLKSMARTGRDMIWTQRGISAFGGGLLGLFMMKLVEKSEEKKARERDNDEKRQDIFDLILKLFG